MTRTSCTSWIATRDGRGLPGRHRLGGRVLFIFSPDGRSLVSVCGGITPADRNTFEVKLWDVITGEELAGLPERFGIAYGVVFSPDGRSLVTVEATGTNRTSPVRLWTLSDDRRRVTLRESLHADQLPDRLRRTRRTRGPTSRPFQLSDVLAVTLDPVPTTAVWTEGREIRLYYTASGYSPAYCVVEGDEVIVQPRNDRPALCTPDELRRGPSHRPATDRL